MADGVGGGGVTLHAASRTLHSQTAGPDRTGPDPVVQSETQAAEFGAKQLLPGSG